MRRNKIQALFMSQFNSGDTKRATMSHIINMEHDFNTILPQSYVDFMLNYGETYSPSILDLIVKSKSNIPDVQTIFSIYESINSTRNYWSAGMPPDLIAFGSDCMGNVFCFKKLLPDSTRPDDAPVWFYDHDFAEVSVVANYFDKWLLSFIELKESQTEEIDVDAQLSDSNNLATMHSSSFKYYLMNEIDLMRQWTDELLPVRLLVERLFGDDSIYDPMKKVLRISHKPHLGSQAFAVTLFGGITEEIISSYEKINHMDIPEIYRNILRKLNGAWLFKLDLEGIPESMAQEPPLLDYAGIQPRDISISNKDTKARFKVDKSYFCFGSNTFSYYDKLVGCFLDNKGTIYAYKENGKLEGTWLSFSDFFEKEIAHAESCYPEYEKQCQNVPKKEPWWKRLF